MSSLEEIKIDLVGLGDILKNNNLSVPIYQRSYAWKDQNVLDLLQDITTAIKDGASEYFLGSIVMSQKNTERPEVVDGQQRLATVTILLAAIRDHFYNVNDETRAHNIEDDYLVKTDLGTLEKIPKLKLNEADNDFFLGRILNPPNSEAKSISASKESHKRIEKASKLSSSHIRNLSEIYKNPTSELVQLVKFVEKNAKVILVRVPDDANAFTIFETLNDRGLPLAISDLLKNYLFHLSGNRLEEAQQRWISMTGALEAVDSEDLVVTYIRQFWSSKYGLTRERELYKNIKSKTSSKQQAIDLSTELNINARYYAAMLNPSHEIWNDYGATSRDHMETLNELGMIQLRPLLLAVLAKFSVQEVRKCMKVLLSWSVRFLIVGGLGYLETQYCDKAVEIRKGKIKTAKDLVNSMKDVVPTDREFHQAFINATVSKDYLARYYLRVLENQFKGVEYPELIPNSNEDIVNLEHILPENPDKDWAYIEPELIKSNYKRIGNMALLSKKINSEIGNKNIKVKSMHYKSSDFELTKILGLEKNWDINSIDERQKMFADLAVKAWPNKA